LYEVFDNLLMLQQTIYIMARAGSKTRVCKVKTVHYNNSSSVFLISQIIGLIIDIAVSIIGYTW